MFSQCDVLSLFRACDVYQIQQNDNDIVELYKKKIYRCDDPRGKDNAWKRRRESFGEQMDLM